MRKLFVALFLTSIALPQLHALHSSVPANQPVTPRPLPPAEEAEKPAHPRSFFQRLFGPRPTPTPAPTPPPVVKHRPKPKPKTAPGEMPVEAVTKVTPTGTTPLTPVTAVKPKTGKSSVKKGTTAPNTVNAVDDATRFKVAKAKALEDAHIKELKSKADGEVDEAAAHKALLNYNRALFQKIRDVDPSLSDYAGKVEQAMTKRIGAEKVKE